MNIFVLLVAIIGGLAGLLSTLYLAFSLPAVIAWKCYRKVRFGIAMNN